MKKYKINAITKKFLKNEQGAYGIATGILSIPLFMIVAFTIDITGALKDKSQLERVLDSAAYTITAENSKFRPKTFQKPQNCNESYQSLSYDQMSRKTTECQYYLILADIENRTQQKGLVSDIKRNELMIEATARVFLGSNDLIASANNRITKNIRFDCRRESNTIYPDASGIICAVAGTIKPRGLQSTNSRIDGKYIDPKNEIALGANGVATRADIIPPPLDIVISVDISAPLINKGAKNYSYFSYRDTSSALVVLYRQQKENLKNISEFIGKLENKVFSGVMNPNNRISYLAFSGGGQEVPLVGYNGEQPVHGEYVYDQPGYLRTNVWPYVIAGGSGTSNPSKEELTFRFYSDYYFGQLYFPFAKGQGGGSNFTNSSVCQPVNDNFGGCTWQTKAVTLEKPQDSHTNYSNITVNSLNINDTETILTQYLLKRFIQETNPNFIAGSIGSQVSQDCSNQYTLGDSQNGSIKYDGQAIGINCYDSETNLSGSRVNIGVSSVFVGVDGLIDPKLTVAKIAKFNGKEQGWILKRLASIPDILMVTYDYPEKPNNQNANKILDSGDTFVTSQRSGYKTDYYNFTPTRNSKDIKSTELNNQTVQNKLSSQYYYTNAQAVLVSQWEDKNSYKINQTNSNTLKDKFNHIYPSGVSFPSSGFLLGANRMMDINPNTKGQKTQRVMVVITSDRNERQDLLMSKGLMQDYKMCDAIRKKFSNDGKDFDGTIFIVDVAFTEKNNYGGVNRPSYYNVEYGVTRDANFNSCVNNDSTYFIKSHYNTLDQDLQRVINKIVEKNAALGGINRPISIHNLPMYK